jgi:hypothetical protein
MRVAHGLTLLTHDDWLSIARHSCDGLPSAYCLPVIRC